MLEAGLTIFNLNNMPQNFKWPNMLRAKHTPPAEPHHAFQGNTAGILIHQHLKIKGGTYGLHSFDGGSELSSAYLELSELYLRHPKACLCCAA